MHLFKNFLMTIKRFYASSLLNIIGLAVAFATAYLILVQINYDFSFNKDFKDIDRIFVLEIRSQYNKEKYSSWMSRPIAELFSKDNPTVEAYGIMPPSVYTIKILLQKGNERNQQILNLSRATKGGLDVLNVKAIKGDLSRFTEPRAVILTESAAARMNADIDDKISASEKWDDNQAFNVVAIIPDFPRISNYKDYEGIFDYGDEYLNDYEEWSFTYLVKLNSPDDKDAFAEQAVKTYFDFLKANGDYSEEDLNKNVDYIRTSIRLLPLSETYFAQDSETGEKGNKATTYTLLAIAVLVILIAFINFINFFMAMAPQRLRGVNTYRVFGCMKSQMRHSFIFESVGLAAIALCFALIIISLLGNSMITEFISTSILMKDNSALIILLVVAGLSFSVIAGIYPATYITSFPLALATKGRFGASKSGKRLRYTLVGIQFIISISLIVCSIFIKLQHNYMMNYDMGFNEEALLTGEVPSKIGYAFIDREAFASELKKNTQIKDVTYANGKLVAAGRMGWGREFKEAQISFQCYPVAYNFLDFMGIDVVDGNNFSQADELDTMGVFIFNESARDEFELTLADQIYGHVGNTRIAGFCKDFNFKPLQYNVAPFSFYLMGPNSWKTLSHIYVRTAPNANIDEVIDFIKDEVVKYVPDCNKEDLSYSFFDEELGIQYNEEKKLNTLITLFSLISIIISLMGVFGLVLFETQYSRKEIAIRRVNGASINEILLIFNKHFIRIVLICFVISVPICYFIVDKWLEGFAYRMPIYWWVFALALLIVMAVTIAIVVIRSWKAANANPIESLKNE